MSAERTKGVACSDSSAGANDAAAPTAVPPTADRTTSAAATVAALAQPSRTKQDVMEKEGTTKVAVLPDVARIKPQSVTSAQPGRTLQVASKTVVRPQAVSNISVVTAGSATAARAKAGSPLILDHISAHANAAATAVQKNKSARVDTRKVGTPASVLEKVNGSVTLAKAEEQTARTSPTKKAPLVTGSKNSPTTDFGTSTAGKLDRRAPVTKKARSVAKVNTTAVSDKMATSAHPPKPLQLAAKKANCACPMVVATKTSTASASQASRMMQPARASHVVMKRAIVPLLTPATAKAEGTNATQPDQNLRVRGKKSSPPSFATAAASTAFVRPNSNAAAQRFPKKPLSGSKVAAMMIPRNTLSAIPTTTPLLPRPPSGLDILACNETLLPYGEPLFSSDDSDEDGEAHYPYQHRVRLCSEDGPVPVSTMEDGANACAIAAMCISRAREAEELSGHVALTRQQQLRRVTMEAAVAGQGVVGRRQKQVKAKTHGKLARAAPQVVLSPPLPLPLPVGYGPRRQQPQQHPLPPPAPPPVLVAVGQRSLPAPAVAAPSTAPPAASRALDLLSPALHPPTITGPASVPLLPMPKRAAMASEGSVDNSREASAIPVTYSLESSSVSLGAEATETVGGCKRKSEEVIGADNVPPATAALTGVARKRSRKTKKSEPGRGDVGQRGELSPPPAPAVRKAVIPQHIPSSTSAATSELIHSTEYLAYSWDILRLGTRLGTAALNDCLSGGFGADVSGGNGRWCRRKGPLTAVQALQIVSSLRTKTIAAPAGSALHDVVRRDPDGRLGTDGGRAILHVGLGSGAETDDDDDEEEEDPDSARDAEEEAPVPLPPPPTTAIIADSGPGSGPSLPLTALSRLYRLVCDQDADDGAAGRRESHYLSADACADRLRRLENRACELRVKQRAIMETGRMLGLDGQRNPSLRDEVRWRMGYRTSGEVMSVPPRRPIPLSSSVVPWTTAMRTSRAPMAANIQPR